MEDSGGASVSGGLSAQREWGWERGLLVALCGLVAWFYVWTARSNGEPWRFGSEQRDYYNLLIDGWLDGQLHMKVDVPEALLRLENPYDPEQRAPGLGLHDATFFQGKYYVYFGPAPVVAVMLPFRLLTGRDLPLPAAIVTLAYGGFLVSASVWWFLRRRYFPEAGIGWSLGGVAALAVVSMVPLLLRRPNIWELPLSGGYFFSMTALACVCGSLHAGRTELRWLAGASVALGLAVASRPTYVFTGLLLVVPLLWRWKEEAGEAGRWRRAGGRALAAFVPIGCVGIGVALYNWMRFGNPLEFGVSYMFSGVYEAKMRHFDWGYLPYNLKLYFFQPAQWGWYFPFLNPVRPSAFPPGYFGFEFVYGLLLNAPLLWLAFVAPFVAAEKGRGRLVAVLVAALAVTIGTASVLSCFYAAMARYQTDFAPALTLAACVGALALERRVRRWSGAKRGVVRTALFAVGAVSVVFGLLASFELYGNLRRGSPLAYARLAEIANRPVSWLERVVGVERGPMELTIRLPQEKRSGREVMAATGAWGAADAVFVEYLDDGRVRVGYAHGGAPDVLSRPLTLDRTHEQRWWIELGSLWPPETHPFFGDVARELRWRATRRLSVEIDGEVVLDAERRFHSGVSPFPRMGEAAARVTALAPFSGSVGAATRGVSLAQLEAERADRMAMRVQFRVTPTSQWQPLFVAGTHGARWTGVVRVVGSDRVQLGYARQGEPVRPFAVMAVDLARTQELEWSVTARTAEDVRVLAKIDGVPAGMARGGADVQLKEFSTRGLEWEHAETARAFDGIVHSAQRVEALPAARSHVMRLQLIFPQGKSGQREPLVVTGETGRGDQVFAEYLEGARLRFGFDHWGKPPLWSEPVSVAPGEPCELEVTLGSLMPLEKRTPAGLLPVEIKLDGRVVWAFEAKWFPVEPKDVFVARNPIGGTTSGPAFSGSVLQVEFVDDGEAEARTEKRMLKR